MDAAKTRILFLITTADWGGAQHVVFRIAAECRTRGMEVLVAAGGTGELESRCHDAGIPYRTLAAMRREISLFHDLAALHELRLLLREYKPTVVHLNSSKIGILGAMAANMERVPRVIYRIGGWAFLEDIGRVKQWLYLTAERWSASKKDAIVTVHPGDEQIGKRLGIRPRGRMLTIPNGIDLPAFDRSLLPREEARRALGLPADALCIGTVANFYPPKNIPWFLRTIAPLFSSPLTAHGSPIIFVIIGDGPERANIERLHAELTLHDRVILAGRRSDASRLLRAFDIFVLPSSKEGMPNALLEAMAAGLPCIATDVGACRWMLEPGAGVIIPPNDSNALERAIRELMDNPEKRRAFGDAARRAVETRFRWETTVEKTMELF
ncbi:glycosyltransferase family 4 protein [Candidatus Uhrbacteria bacterium]|nr:glycosyltransferase family 4 protein [Candidatus Uhrbacteria bacterium]